MSVSPSAPGRLKKNIVAEASCRLISSGLVILLVPLIMRFYGVSGYGVWEIIITFSQIAVMFQMAITGTMLWALSHSFGQDDLQELSRGVGIGFTTNLVQSGLILLVCWLFGERLAHLFQVPKIYVGPMLLVVAATALTGFSETMSAAVSASHRMRFTSTLRTAGQILQYVLSIGFLLLGFGMWGLAAALSINILVCVVGNRYLMWRFLPEIPVRFCWPTSQEQHRLGSYFGSLSVGVISQTLRGQLDKGVLAYYATPAWVGYYGIATRLCMLIFEFNRYFYMPLIPAAAALQATGDQKSLNSLFARFMTLTGLATGVMTVMVAGLYPRILMAWIGRVQPQVVELMFLLIVPGFVQMILSGPGSAICRGTGRAKLESVYLALSLMLNIVLTIALVRIIGPIGTVIASAIATFISVIFFSVILYVRTPLPVEPTLRTIPNMVAVCLTVAGTLFLGAHLPMGHLRIVNLVWVAALAVPAIAVYLSLFVLFGAGDTVTLSSLGRRNRVLRCLIELRNPV